jgi:hypothetical protein
MPKYQSTQETPWTQSANALVDTLNSVFDAQQKRKQMEIKNAYDQVEFAMKHGSGADYDAAVKRYNDLGGDITGGIKLQPRDPNMLPNFEKNLLPSITPEQPEMPSHINTPTGAMPTGVGRESSQQQVVPGQPFSISEYYKAQTQGEKLSPETALRLATLRHQDELMKQKVEQPTTPSDHLKRFSEKYYMGKTGDAIRAINTDPIIRKKFDDEFNKDQTPKPDVYVDDKNMSWRIIYDPKTGDEIKRIKQGPVKDTKRDAYQQDAILQRQVNNFNASPTVQQAEKMDQFANLIIVAANSENPIAHASLETLMARASGEVGNLSEADKKPFGGSRAIMAKTQQYLSEIYNGKKTPENLAFIAQLAELFKKSGQEKKQSIARERSKQIANANKSMGWTPEFVFSVLSPDGEFSSPKQNTNKIGRFNVEVVP